MSSLNNILKNVSDQVRACKLRLNNSKSKCIVIAKRPVDQNTLSKLQLNGEDLEFVSKARNLGITFNETLSWNDHIRSSIGKVYGMLRCLWHTKHCTPSHIRMLLAKAYLMPTLLYGCEIYAGCDSIHAAKLNVLFNNITRYIFNLKSTDSTSTYSIKIYNLTFNELLNLKQLCFLHKIIATREPRYLFEKITFLRSVRRNNLRSCTYQSLNSERQFFVRSTRLWNNLPTHLQRIDNIQMFKKELLKNNRYLRDI